MTINVQKQWRVLKLRLTDERRLRLLGILTALVHYTVLSIETAVIIGNGPIIARRGRGTFEFSPHCGSRKGAGAYLNFVKQRRAAALNGT